MKGLMMKSRNVQNKQMCGENIFQLVKLDNHNLECIFVALFLSYILAYVVCKKKMTVPVFYDAKHMPRICLFSRFPIWNE